MKPKTQMEQLRDDFKISDKQLMILIEIKLHKLKLNIIIKNLINKK